MTLVPAFSRLSQPRLRPAPVVVFALAAVLGVMLAGQLSAQIEGERGILPLATSSDIEVAGIEVNTTGKTGDEARQAGWVAAQRKAWEKAGGSAIGDGQLASMVSAMVIGHEMIGPHRYIATLGVVFDRQRAGQFLAGGDLAHSHSMPLLVIPLLVSGGVAQVFEVKGAWQKAWAEFAPGMSPVNYIRPSGANGDSLVLTAGQPGRRSRTWWHTVLSQFGAADVVIPEARLAREWPGGPVHGTFTARYGPDNTLLESFTLDAPDEAGVETMLQQAVARIDRIYGNALSAGTLKADAALALQGQIDPALAAVIARGQAAEAAERSLAASASPSEAAATTTGAAPAADAAVVSLTIQFSSPDAAAVDAALAAVRSAPGVLSAQTTSLAMGGTSVMRVSYRGDIATLAGILRARGFSVATGNNALSVKH